jgi:hypothetical protein
MSTTAVSRNYISFVGDENYDAIYSSGDLDDSPAMSQLVSLEAATNLEVSVPDVTDFDTHGVLIVPPNGNVEEVTLKGAALDTGIALSATKSSSIFFGATPPASIFLYATEAVDGLRLIWF